MSGFELWAKKKFIKNACMMYYELYHDFSLCCPSIQLFSQVFISDIMFCIFTFLLITFHFRFNKLAIL